MVEAKAPVLLGVLRYALLLAVSSEHFHVVICAANEYLIAGDIVGALCSIVNVNSIELVLEQLQVKLRVPSLHLPAEELAYLAWVFDQIIGHIGWSVEGHDLEVRPRDGPSEDGTEESDERDEEADAAAD